MVIVSSLFTVAAAAVAAIAKAMPVELRPRVYDLTLTVYGTLFFWWILLLLLRHRALQKRGRCQVVLCPHSPSPSQSRSRAALIVAATIGAGVSAWFYILLSSMPENPAHNRNQLCVMHLVVLSANISMMVLFVLGHLNTGASKFEFGEKAIVQDGIYPIRWSRIERGEFVAHENQLELSITPHRKYRVECDAEQFASIESMLAARRS